MFDSQTHIIENEIKEHITVIDSLKDLSAVINDVANLIADCLQSNGKIILCGNGGSSSDSQHIAAEFVGRFIEDRKALAAIALNSDTAILTSVSNDYGYDFVFERQIEALGNENDILMAFTSSGSSKNINIAVKKAQEMGIKVIGFTGKSGGDLKPMSDFSLHIASEVTARIQEAHLFLGHVLCKMVERKLNLD